MKIILAIPCYNCEKQIVRVLNSLTVEIASKVNKIIILDNYSTDKTLNSAIKSIKLLDRTIQNKIFLYQNNRNIGLGGSFKSLIETSVLERADYLAVLHGDDQASIHDLLDMIHLKEIQDLSVDCIFGARFMSESKLIGYSKTREYGNRFINLIFSCFTGKRIHEIGSGLNIYKVSSLPIDEIMNWPNHIAFDVNLLLGFIKNKANIIFHPISWKEYDQTSNAKNINTALLVLKMLFRFKLGLNNSNEQWNIDRPKKRVEL